MKRELVLAVGLLAVGCLLFRNGFSPSDIEKPSKNPLSHSAPHDVSNATYLEELSAAQDSDAGIPAINNTRLATSDPARLLASAAVNLFESDPISCKAQINVHLFEKTTVAHGYYYQQGQRTRKSRFEFQFEGESGTQIIQISDGRFSYLWNSMGEADELNVVDLEKVALENANQSIPGVAPATWFAGGGISSLLSNFADAFQFEPPTRTTLGKIPVIRLRGHWKPEALAASLEGQIDPDWISPEIRWEKLPRQIPHTIEILLGDDQFLPLFPYRIEFQQYTELAGEYASQPFIDLTLSEVSKIREGHPEEFFIIQSKNIQVADLTDVYLERVKQLRHNALVRFQAIESEKKRTAAKPDPASSKNKSPGVR